jgi:hypothetical protein
MATHWLREITSTATGSSTGFPFASKALAMFLRYVLGYVNNAEKVDVIDVGNSVSAPDGANKQTFTASSARFFAGDVGLTITTSNMVDPNNDGAFTITDYVGPTQIKYVNAAGSLESSSFDWVLTVPGQGHFSSEKSGTNGSINTTGTDKGFQDTTAASFVGGDTGKWILIQDTTNPENSGWYKVTYVDASNVTLDYRSGAAEYPTQNTGANLSWWLAADNYQVPDRHEAWWRLETPHANGWAIEMMYEYPSTDQMLSIRVAVDGSWVGSKILSSVLIGVDNSEVPWFYCAADDGGEFINFFFHNNSDGFYGGFIAANLDLAEPDRVAEEQVVLMGNRGASAGQYNGDTYVRDASDLKLGRGNIWSEREQVERILYMLELSYKEEYNGFSGWVSRTVNVRNSNQWDVIEGVPVVVDPISQLYPQNHFEIPGRIKGVFLTSGAAAERTAQNDEGTLDKFHIQDGLAIEWPGVTEQH